MNILLISGRVVADPEIIATSETDVCNFRVAMKKRNNEAQFLLCTAFGKRAEAIHKYARKGLRIMIRGYLELQEYSEENRTRIIPKCIVTEFELLDFSKEDNEEEWEY